MYIAAFHYLPGTYDAEFHRLNDIIDSVAKASPGFVGSESWRSVDGTQANATYYWRDLDSLKAFSTHPAHQEAKRQYARWYEGYHIVISQVIRSYGDGKLPHFTRNERERS